MTSPISIVSGKMPARNVSLLSRAANAKRRMRKDRLVQGALTFAMITAMIPLILIIAQVVERGGYVLVDNFPGFFVLKEFPPSMAGGGYAAGFVGTGLMMVMAVAMAVPIGLAAAVYLTEYGKGWFAGVIRFFTDVMTGIPSVFVGLAVYGILIVGSGGQLSFGGFVGAVAIAIVMLPIIVRTAEEVLKTVSPDMKRGSDALGARKWQTTTKVVLPAAAPGLATSVMLAIARGTGETAPLILTAFGNINVVFELFNVPMGAVPLQIYNGARQPFEAGLERAWGGALALVLIILVLTVIARYIGSKASKAHRI